MKRISRNQQKENPKGELANLTKGLPKPKDYFRGEAGYSGTLPENILCFGRQSAQELSRFSHLYHHHRWVLIVALAGGGRVCVDEREIPLRPGEALVIAPFQYHSYSAVDARIEWLFSTWDLWPEPDALRGKNAALDDWEREVVVKFVEAWKTGDGTSALLLALLLQRLASKAQRRQGRMASGPDAPLLARINQLAIPRLDSPMALTELARATGVSESHLRARFRQATGMSLGKHLRHLRLGRACRLLYDGEMPVGAVAEACGFENVFAFSRAFKTAFGKSPKAYRREVREE